MNIIPLSMVERIGYLQIEPYARKLQMADKTCKTLVGIVKDVLIEINKLSFPIHFVILDVKAGLKIPLIL